MRNTTNYNLKLPEGPDKYNIQDFNSNAEKIDMELKRHADSIADRYDKTEIDNKFSMHEMKVDWKESVDTFDDIATTYPNPESGWTVNTKDMNYTYRYDGTAWVAISANAIPKATEQLDGLMSKEKFAEVNQLKSNISNIQTNVTELNSALLNKQSYPDYSKISTIISGGVGTKTYTCTENGFVQFVGASGNNSVKPEIDLSINGVYVFKYRTGYQTTYVKATSGLFPVKQGDVIKCVIQSSFVNDESVRFYQLRY